MSPTRGVLLVALGLTGCAGPSELELRCRENDPGIRPSACYAAAWDEGYVDGYGDGRRDGYDEGYASCPTDTGDTGDTGAR